MSLGKVVLMEQFLKPVSRIATAASPKTLARARLMAKGLIEPTRAYPVGLAFRAQRKRTARTLWRDVRNSRVWRKERRARRKWWKGLGGPPKRIPAGVRS